MLKLMMKLNAYYFIFCVTQSLFCSFPNTVTGIVTDLVPATFNQPFAIAISPDGTIAYVTNLGSTIESNMITRIDSGNGSVSVIDIATNSVIGTVTDMITPTFFQPTSIAFTSDGLTAYVVNNEGDSISIINVATHTVTGMVVDEGVTLNSPIRIAIAPDGTKAYITNYESGLVPVSYPQELATATVSILSLSGPSTNTITGTINVGLGPIGVAFTPVGDRAYVASNIDDIVSVIDTMSDVVIDILTDISRPAEIAITPDSDFVYVTKNVTNFVDMIETLDNTITEVTDTDSLLYTPQGITIMPNGVGAYVANGLAFGACYTISNTGTVTMINIADNSVIGYVNDPDEILNNPSWIAITSDNLAAYVTNQSGNSVSILGVQDSILPPSLIEGFFTRNRFLVQTDLINFINWTAPVSGTVPTSYTIYRDAALSDFVASISADKLLQYYDHNRQPYTKYNYYVVSVDGNNNISTPISISITTQGK